ncbi:MAG: squalene/phytoene synthase family protein, partial [Gammaproteobacteria bacterium]|nr:squalene/phytoene synthase family protein [Gammaproteobacteria bacterium]
EPVTVPEEGELLRSLEGCFVQYRRLSPADRGLIRRLVTTLTLGMEMDLEHFPPGESGTAASLEDSDELDRYCYYVAGCVGEFWTDLQCAHLTALNSWNLDYYRRLGVGFGKGLQLTNILRDVDRDLLLGRCYLPRERLEEVGTTAEKLRSGMERDCLRPLIHDLIRQTLGYYRQGWEYTLALPRHLPTLRLACIWPLWIGLLTLERIARSKDPCASNVVLKISRREIYGLMAVSVSLVFSNRLLAWYCERLFRRVSLTS